MESHAPLKNGHVFLHLLAQKDAHDTLLNLKIIFQNNTQHNPTSVERKTINP